MKFPIFSRTGILLLVFSMLLSLVGCGGGGGGGSSAAPSLAITSQPADQTVAAGGAARFSVVALRNMIGVAVGTNGKILRSADGGASWSQVAPLDPNDLMGVAFVDATTVVAVGGGSMILRSIDAGQTWQDGRSTGVFIGDFAQVQFSGLIGTIQADSQNTDLRSTDGGLTWGIAPKPCRAAAIAFGNSNNTLGVGTDGCTLQSLDSGATWRMTSSSLQSPTSGSRLTVTAFNKLGVGIAVGEGFPGPIMVRSADYGKSWSKVDLSSAPSFGPSSPTAIVFANNSTVFAAGDRYNIYRSTDSGNTWMAVSSNAGAGSYVIVNIAFSPDAMTGVAITEEGVMVRTVDAGITWTKVANVPFIPNGRLAFGSASLVIAVGGHVVDQGNTILRSTDGGQTWTRISVGLYGGLSHIAFSSPTTAVAVGNGILLTTDGGLTWTYPQDQPDAWGHHYGAVVFSSEGVGLILSQGSQTYASNGTPNPIARSAVLRSTDGGHSWKKDTDVPEDLTGAIHFADAHSPIALGARMKIFRGIGY
jgi:photosystem II stability/assembly factor-like uncharacterized protein